LLELTRSLNEESQRHVRESLTEEELTIFDILTRPEPELSPEEREEVRKLTRHLLSRLKSLLVIEWRGRVQTRAAVKEAIESTLDEGLPRVYTPTIFENKCARVFEHVYEAYVGEGKSIFTAAAYTHSQNG
jgi:type I restriction enzyme R subunit